MTKLIIAGSRTLHEMKLVEHGLVASGFMTELEKITEIVSGDAAGIDTLGARWAMERGIFVKHFPVTQANVRLFGKIAFRSRNQRMADYADVCLAIWDGSSPGTRHMIQQMEERRKPVFVCVTKKEGE